MQKKCKKFLLSGMVFALILALTGCDIPEDGGGILGPDISTEEESTENGGTLPEEGDGGEDEETTTPETGEGGEGGNPGGDQGGESGGNESQESGDGSGAGESDTDQKVEPAAAFDEEFVIKPGEKLYIGTSEVCIKLTQLFYDEESEWTNFCYELKMGDTVYEGDGYWSTSMGGNVNQSEYTSNRVQVVSADKGNSVTFKITSAKEVKVPFVLSGNPEDEYVTTQPEYVVSEDIILFLDEGVKVYGDTMELIETIRDLVEKETGLSMVNDTEYGQMRMSNMLSLLYGQETFAGVDHKKEKMHIYVVPYEKSSAQGSYYYLVLNPKDLEIAAGKGDTLVHEMTHVIHLANGIELGRKLTEGYATYITGKIADRDEVIPFDFDSDFNYSFYEREITIENAEVIFAEEPADEWENYPYGYRFMNFLFETYGEDIFRTLLADANVEFKEYYDMITNEKMVPIIKRNTEEEVFVKFAEWLSLNKDRFEDSDNGGNGGDSANWEDCPTEPVAAFDQEFTIKPGEMLCIGSPEVCIWLDMVSYDEESEWTDFCYELKVGDRVYEGDGYWSASMGGNVNQSEYTPNRVQVVSVDKGNSVTFKITSAKEVKAPFILSGNPEDEYVTTQPEYVVSEDIILFLDEGVKVYGDTMELIETIRGLVEKETGLSLVNDTEYGQMRTSNMLSLIYGQETFAGVDHKKEKMHIYVAYRGETVPNAGSYYLFINPENLEIAAGKGDTLVHEMTHVIHMANGIQLGRKLTEGYATYIAGKIADRDEVIPFDLDSDSYYSYYEREITGENAEAIFAEEPWDSWEVYLYGYRFVNFLFETYGEDIFRTLLADANVEFKEYYDMITNETLVPVIKRNTEEEVFVKFAEWLSLNKDRFEDSDNGGNGGDSANWGDCPTEPAVAFDQEFTITPGEMLCIGSPEVGILLNNVIYNEEYDISFFYYELKIGDIVCTGSGTWSFSMGGNVNQSEYTPNRVQVVSADKGNSVTFKITEAKEVKAPLVLSGNPEDEYVTTQPEYVLSEDMILFLDEGVKVYGNTMELIETIRDLIEKETGLSLVNDTEYGQMRVSDMLSYIYGQEAFAGVDHKHEKMHIYVAPYEKISPQASNYFLAVNPEDLEIAAGDGFALVHEMTHVIHTANGEHLGGKLTEGYATYITGKIADRDEVIPFNFDADYNYSYYQREITAENAEAIFGEEPWDNWENYLYGYRFMNFLFETYGEDIFRSLLADANVEFKEHYDIMTNAEMIPVIKRNTEEEVFVKFAEWLSLNKDRFGDTENSGDAGDSGDTDNSEGTGGTEDTENYPTEPMAAFDQEFTIKPGEVLCIGSPEICIKLITLRYDEAYEWADIFYELKIGDNVYNGNGSWSPTMGGNVNQYEYTSNQLQIVSVDQGNSVTLKLTSAREIKSPIALSGNPEDVYVTTQPEYVISEDMVLFLDEGITVHGNAMELVKTIRSLVEKETGLFLVNDSKYGQMRTSNMLSYLYGQEVFAGVDHKHEKMHIYVVPTEKGTTYAGNYYLQLNPEDLELAAGAGDALVHEMTQVIYFANGIDMGRKLTEGYAAYITGKITEKDEVISFDFDANLKYSGYQREITGENAEAVFAEETWNAWEDYQYGYRFVNFLFETYGEGVFRTLLADASGEEGKYYFTNAEIIPIIKRNTEEEVFVKFSDWLSLNKDRFMDN